MKKSHQMLLGFLTWFLPVEKARAIVLVLSRKSAKKPKTLEQKTQEEANERKRIEKIVETQTDAADYPLIKDAVWQSFKIVTQQSPDLSMPRKRTLFLLGNYRATDWFKGTVYFLTCLLFIYLAPLLIWVIGSSLLNWWLGFFLAAAYTAANFTVWSLHSLKSGSERGGEVATIYFWGMPVRDHGTYGGFYRKFWWETVIFSFGDYTEIEFDFNLPCSDGVKRKNSLQVSLRLKRPWGAKDILSPEDVRLPENFDWTNSKAVEAFKKLITQKLTIQFRVDFESALQIVLVSISSQQTGAKDTKDQKEKVHGTYKMIAEYTRLVQKAMVLVTKLAIFEDEVIEIRRLQLHIKLGEKELAVAERVKVAGAKVDESREIWNGFVEDARRFYGLNPVRDEKDPADDDDKDILDKIAKLASDNFESWQRGEGLRQSGKGSTAAGTEAGGKQK